MEAWGPRQINCAPVQAWRRQERPPHFPEAQMPKCSYAQALPDHPSEPSAIVQETNGLLTCTLRESGYILIGNKHHISEIVDNTAESGSTYDTYARALQVNWDYTFNRID